MKLDWMAVLELGRRLCADVASSFAVEDDGATSSAAFYYCCYFNDANELEGRIMMFSWPIAFPLPASVIFIKISSYSNSDRLLLWLPKVWSSTIRWPFSSY